MRQTIAMLCVFLGCAVGSAQTCVPAPYGIISWYPAEGTAQDVIGGNNGGMTGLATFGPGRVRQAFVFQGQPNDAVTLGNVTAFDFSGADSFSIEAWVNIASLATLPNDGSVIVALNYHCTLPTPAMQMLAIQIGGKAFFAVRDALGNQSTVLTSGPVQTNKWIHLVGVRDAACHKIYLYVNGAPATLPVADSTATTGSLANNVSDYIGRRPLCGTTDPFNGKIDEVAIYRRALTACEVAALYNANCAGKCRPGSCAGPACGC
jgi:hypothetical protein